MSRILRKLEAQICDDQFAVVAELGRRLAPFGYSRDEVIEHALYHGSKVLENVAAGHEARAAAAARVTKSTAGVG